MLKGSGENTVRTETCLIPLPQSIVLYYSLHAVYRMQAVQNLGLAIVTIVSGLIVDKAGYLILEVFFLACLCIALIAGKVCTCLCLDCVHVDVVLCIV